MSGNMFKVNLKWELKDRSLENPSTIQGSFITNSLESIGCNCYIYQCCMTRVWKRIENRRVPKRSIMLAGVRKMLNHAHTKSRLSPSHNLRDWKRSEREWSLVRSVIFKARSVYCPTSFRELLVLKSWSRMQTLIQNDKDYSWLSFHLASAKSLGSMRQTSI